MGRGHHLITSSSSSERGHVPELPGAATARAPVPLPSAAGEGGGEWERAKEKD